MLRRRRSRPTFLFPPDFAVDMFGTSGTAGQAAATSNSQLMSIPLSVSCEQRVHYSTFIAGCECPPKCAIDCSVPHALTGVIRLLPDHNNRDALHRIRAPARGSRLPALSGQNSTKTAAKLRGLPNSSTLRVYGLFTQDKIIATSSDVLASRPSFRGRVGTDIGYLSPRPQYVLILEQPHRTSSLQDVNSCCAGECPQIFADVPSVPSASKGDVGSGPPASADHGIAAPVPASAMSALFQVSAIWSTAQWFLRAGSRSPLSLHPLSLSTCRTPADLPGHARSRQTLLQLALYLRARLSRAP